MTARLFLQVVSLETRKLMSYRTAFWLEASVAFLAQLGVAYFLWRAVYEATGRPIIGGYTEAEMLLYYILAILLGKVIRGQERASSLAQDVYEGSLSRYLVYPGDYLAFKYAEHLGTMTPAVLQLLLFGFASLPFLEAPAAAGIGAGSLARGIFAVALGNLLNFLLLYPIQGIAFWAENVWSLSVLMRLTASLLGGAMMPLALFPAGARALLEWSPFPYLYDFPVNVLLGRIPPDQWLRGVAIGVAWCGLLHAVGRWVWRRGGLSYTGVGM